MWSLPKRPRRQTPPSGRAGSGSATGSFARGNRGGRHELRLTRSVGRVPVLELARNRMRRLKKLSKRPRTSGLLAGCLAAVASGDGLRRLCSHLPPDPHRRPEARRLQGEGLLPTRSGGRLQRRQRASDDPAAPRQALRAHPPGRRYGRRPRRSQHNFFGAVGHQDQGRRQVQSGDDRRQRHRPHLRRLPDTDRRHAARRSRPHRGRRRWCRRGDPRHQPRHPQQSPRQQHRRLSPEQLLPQRQRWRHLRQQRRRPQARPDAAQGEQRASA